MLTEYINILVGQVLVLAHLRFYIILVASVLVFQCRSYTKLIPSRLCTYKLTGRL